MKHHQTPVPCVRHIHPAVCGHKHPARLFERIGAVRSEGGKCGLQLKICGQPVNRIAAGIPRYTAGRPDP